MPRHGDANRMTGDCLGLMVLSSMVLDVLLMIDGVEQNPGPAVEGNTIQLLSTGCSITVIGVGLKR